MVIGASMGAMMANNAKRKAPDPSTLSRKEYQAIVARQERNSKRIWRAGLFFGSAAAAGLLINFIFHLVA